MRMNFIITNPEKANIPNRTYDTRIVKIEGTTAYIKVVGEGVPFPSKKGVPFPSKKSTHRIRKAN